MSVRVADRGPNLAQVDIKSEDLLAYTIKLVGNEKYFKRRFKEELNIPIIDMTRRIMHVIHFAFLTVPNDKETYEEKLRLYTEACHLITLLQKEIKLNMNHFSLDKDKAIHWSSLCDELRGLCLDNKASTKKKYSNVVQK